MPQEFVRVTGLRADHEIPGGRTLTQVGDGQSVRVECLRGEVSDCQRLREMGFCELAQVKKITGSGALICKVCDTRVVISAELAENIIVGECTPDGGVSYA
jgi:ferrous iron transport protein A